MRLSVVDTGFATNRLSNHSVFLRYDEPHTDGLTAACGEASRQGIVDGLPCRDGTRSQPAWSCGIRFYFCH